MELFSKEQGKKIGRLLLNKNETISVAESVSAGMLQLAFAAMENSTNFFQGGLTAYNLAQKTRQLHVEPIHAQSVNCVSTNVARQMALNVCTSFLSDWGLALTGYATPVPESDHKTFAFFGIAYKGKILACGKLLPKKTETQDIQLEYTQTVLSRLQALLAKQSSTQKKS